MPRGKTNESNKAKKSSNKQSNTKGSSQSKKKSDAAASKNKSNAREKIAAGQVKNSRSSAAGAKEKVSNAAASKNKRIAKWEESDNLVLLEGWARDGLSMEQIAHNMGISKKTLYNYQESSLPILHAIKKGKEVTDYLVENALFTSALTGNVVAQIFWLKNRKPDKWKDKVEQVIDTEADTAGIVLLAPVLEKNNEPTEESDMGATTETN